MNGVIPYFFIEIASFISVAIVPVIGLIGVELLVQIVIFHTVLTKKTSVITLLLKQYGIRAFHVF
ncbi:MAG: Uncharacterised protein [Flavobacteriaceae bacterium]|nr:MAG: Uncharacterised protein [Flavobacteriaceae bacterium]